MLVEQAGEEEEEEERIRDYLFVFNDT